MVRAAFIEFACRWFVDDPDRPLTYSDRFLLFGTELRDRDSNVRNFGKNIDVPSIPHT